MNATLLEWSAGAGPPDHVNDERDVLVFVVDGSAKLAVDGEERQLVPGEAVIVPKSIGGGSRPVAAAFATCRSTSAAAAPDSPCRRALTLLESQSA